MPSAHDAHEDEKIERLRRAMYSRELSPRLKEHERRVLDPDRIDVGDDWIREEPKLDPSFSAPRGLGVMRTALWWFLGLAIIFFIGAVSFFIYFVTFGSSGSNASNSNISIVVTGPPTIAGGQVTELQISITNKNSVPLSLAGLTVNYPAGTRSPSRRTKLG